MWKRILLFAVLNFGALFIGSLLMGSPAENDWYQQLNRAPWTPPGWVFGAAWFTIMALFTLFMAIVTGPPATRNSWIAVFSLQWVLNVSWNPLFFRQHFVLTGLVLLVLLFIVLVVHALKARKEQHAKAVFLLLPYLIWMCVAISLNGYIWAKN